MKNFEGFGLSQTMLQSLKKMAYTAPTPIQQKAIPLALDGRDVLGSAQTGTGKTAAFGIPMVEAIMNSDKGSAIVMTPTRELAKQVSDVIHQLLGHGSDINTAFLIGGASMEKQISQLRKQPRIIVGTPGRINDHLERGSLKLHDAGFLVLDETDRMLDMGFGVQIDRILKFMPAKRQTLMFSATMPKEIIQMSGKYLTNPERISMGATNVVATKIKQEIIHIDQGAKYKELVNQLYDRNGSVIIFVKTKYGTERMAKNLRKDGFEADALHGDLRQRKRDQVMMKFRDKKFRILVATDIAARGLDVPHIEHVINHDLPQVAEDYIHRMGRTARAGAEGSALCFISPQEKGKWNAIEVLLDPSKKRDRSYDKKKGKPRRSGAKRGFGQNDNNRDSKPGRKNKFVRGERPKSNERTERGENSYEGSNKGEGKKFANKRPEGSRPEGKKFEGKKKPFGKKPFGKKPFDKKSGGKKPFEKRDDRQGDNRSEGKKFEGKKKPFNKDGAKPTNKKTGKPSFGKSGGKNMKGKPAHGGKTFAKGPKRNNGKPAGSKSIAGAQKGSNNQGGNKPLSKKRNAA